MTSLDAQIATLALKSNHNAATKHNTVTQITTRAHRSDHNMATHRDAVEVSLLVAGVLPGLGQQAVVPAKATFQRYNELWQLAAMICARLVPIRKVQGCRRTRRRQQCTDSKYNQQRFAPVDVVGVEAELALLGVLLDGRRGLVLGGGGAGGGRQMPAPRPRGSSPRTTLHARGGSLPTTPRCRPLPALPATKPAPWRPPSWRTSPWGSRTQSGAARRPRAAGSRASS